MKLLFGKFLGLTKSEENLLACCYDIEFSLPSNVKVIGKKSFYDTFKLDAIKIHFGVKVIEESAFEKCDQLHHFIFEHGAMLTTVGDRAFFGCERLINIEFPLSLKSLGKSAFENCIELQTVSFEEDSYLESIGDNAFKGCTYLTSIVIPKFVTKMGKDVFKDCPNVTIFCEAEEKPDSWPSDWNNGSPVIWGCKRIEEGYYSLIYGEKDNKVYAYIDKFNEHQITKFEIPNKVDNKEYILKGLNMSLFRKSEVIKSIVLPSCISYLGPYTFYKCNYLESITFDKDMNIPSIGHSAFEECHALKSIDIPTSVTSIESHAFSGCISLSNVNIPNSVTYLASCAFQYCISLFSVTIPNSVTEIGSSSPFYECYHLGEIINESNEEIGWVDSDIIIHSKEESRLTITDDGYVLRTDSDKKKVTLIGYIGNSEAIVVPNVVTTIRSHALYHYEFVTSITLPTSVTYIQDYAFFGVGKEKEFKKLRYEGTIEEWKKIKKEHYWYRYLDVAYVTCKNGEVKKSER